MLRKNKLPFLIIIAFFVCKCSGGPAANEPTDTATSGEVKIIVDESFKPIFEEQIYTFESIYPNAKINAAYTSEGDALTKLMNDSCKVVVLSHDITSKERKVFESNNIFPISTKIAGDAIAVIVNNENLDTALTVENIRNMLLGNDSLWSQVTNSLTDNQRISIVFDNKGSTNARYMKDSVLNGREFAKNVFTENSTMEVIDYVRKTKGALGFIGVNWISDQDDPKVQAILDSVKVIAVSKTTAEQPVKPFQAYIQTKEYPFTRDVYMINRQTRSGLGMGFVSFVAGEKGQLMFLKSGLIPGFPPERMIKIKED